MLAFASFNDKKPVNETNGTIGVNNATNETITEIDS